MESQRIPAEEAVTVLWARKGERFCVSVPWLPACQSRLSAVGGYVRASSNDKLGTRCSSNLVEKNKCPERRGRTPTGGPKRAGQTSSKAERLPPSRLERNPQVPDAGTVGLEVALAHPRGGAVLDGRVIREEQELDIVNKAKELGK